MVRKSKLAALIVLGLTLACGSDGNGSGGGGNGGGNNAGGDGGNGGGNNAGGGGAASSGVSGSKKLNEITDAEARALCEWFSTSLTPPSDEQLCTLYGLLFASDEAGCKAFVQDCLEDDAAPGDEEPTNEDDCEDATAEDLGASCTATVRELETCLKDSQATSLKFYEGLNCSQAGSFELDESAYEEPQSCETLEMKCPEAFADEEEI